MNSYGILRIPKSLRLTIKQENQNKAVLVKEEPFSDFIKIEPKTENYSEIPLLKEELNCVEKEEPDCEEKEESDCAEKEESDCTEKEELLDEDINVPPQGILRKQSIARRGKNRFWRNTRRPTYTRPLFRAINIHRVLMNKDPDSLSSRQLNSLTWAEKVIVNETFRRAQRAAGNHAINEEISTPPENIKSFETITISDEFESKRIDDAPLDALQLVVVDFGKPGGRYSLEQGKMIEKAVGKAVVNHILKNLSLKPPTFGSPMWHDGVIILDCKNRKSYDFAKDVVGDMKLWAGSALKAVPPEEVPFKSKGRLYTPDLGIETEQVLEVLKCQNPLVNMKKWKIYKEFFSINGSNRYTLLITDPPVTLLQNKQLRLFFGAGKVTLKLLGCNWPDEVKAEPMDSVDEVILIANRDTPNTEVQKEVMNTSDEVILVTHDDICPQINQESAHSLDEVVLVVDKDTSSQSEQNAAQES